MPRPRLQDMPCSCHSQSTAGLSMVLSCLVLATFWGMCLMVVCYGLTDPLRFSRKKY